MTGRFTAGNWPILTLLVFGLSTGTCTSVAQCHFKNTDSADTIIYRFSPEELPNSTRLKIDMTFPLTAAIPVEVDVPSELIRDLHLEGTQATLRDGPSGTKTVLASTSGPVTLSYTLENGWTGPMVHPREFEPVIRPEYLEITGAKALVWLKRDPNQRVTANFDWQQLPRTWVLATSFGVADTALEQRCQTYAGPWTKVNKALFAAGDFRLHPFKIGRRPGVLAVRGTWTFSDEEAADQIGHTIESIREFWHDDAFPYFLVTLQPFDQDHGSSDGTAYTNAFWMYVSRKDSISGLLPLLAHESFHAWNPFKMGYLSPPEYEKTKWFKEGFTEYYAQKLVFESGELSAPKLVDSINSDLVAFPSSTDVYVRGRVIALWLDSAIRQLSHDKHSLNDVMFRMVRDGKQPMTEERIFTTIEPYVSAEMLLTLKQAADQQGNLPAPPTIPGVGNCYHATYDDVPKFYLGLDYRKTVATKTVTGVDPSGPAFQAGLRDGQKVVAMHFDGDDPNHPATVTVSEDGEEKHLSFKPLGHPVKAWQYSLDQGQACKGAAAQTAGNALQKQ
jgi:predicted metalloprotease with PDZ domain